MYTSVVSSCQMGKETIPSLIARSSLLLSLYLFVMTHSYRPRVPPGFITRYISENTPTRFGAWHVAYHDIGENETYSLRL